MVRGDEVDAVQSEGLPQLLAVVGRADRRRAFECRRPVWNVLRGERQIMRARFRSERDGRCARGIEN